MELIDKSAIVAEIKDLIRANEVYLSEPKTDEIRFQKVGAYSVLNDLLHFINTINVKEVNLDKEINDYFNEWQNVLCDEDCCNEGGFCCVLDENVKPVNIGRCRKVAKHFFELGLKVKKGE